MRLGYFVLAVLFAAPAYAQETLSVKLGGLDDKGNIKDIYAYCVPTADGKSSNGPNISPELSWSPGPEGTKSYAVIMVDPDVPTVFDDAGKEGKTLAADMPRQNFYHWILLNIPAGVTTLPEGVDSNAATASPKAIGRVAHGWRGINDYTKFKGDGLVYGGYDGPCPPWNDARMHHYHFQVYALNVENLPMDKANGAVLSEGEGRINGQDAVNMLEGKVLASGEAVGTYTLNKELRK